MIYDNVKNAGRYADVEWLSEALANAERYSDATLEIGAYPISEGLRAVVNRYTPAEYESGKFENHREYIDVQYIISGSEKILVAPTEGCVLVKGYDPAADYEMYDAEGAAARVVALPVKAGDFVVLFPDEAHYPGVADGTGSDVRKIVFKVSVRLA